MTGGNLSKNEKRQLLEAYHTIIQADAPVHVRLLAHGVILRHGIRELGPMAAQDRRDEALADLCTAVANHIREHPA